MTARESTVERDIPLRQASEMLEALRAIACEADLFIPLPAKHLSALQGIRAVALDAIANNKEAA